MIHTPACKVQLTSSLPTYDRNFFLSPLGPKKTLCNFPICWIWLEKIRFERKRCRGRKSVRSRREINNSFQQVLHFVTPCIFPPLFWVNPKQKQKNRIKSEQVPVMMYACFMYAFNKKLYFLEISLILCHIACTSSTYLIWCLYSQVTVFREIQH